MRLRNDTVLLVVVVLAVISTEDNFDGACSPRKAKSRTSGEKNLPEGCSEACQNGRNAIYRTFDGTCNHPNNLGAKGKPHSRLANPAYGDANSRNLVNQSAAGTIGINSPRAFGSDNKPLPSARSLSLNIHTNVSAYVKFTHFLMQWGQWTAHDIIATAQTTGSITCCGPIGACPPITTNPNCFPIEVPPGDPYLPGTCSNFVRSRAATDENGVQLVPRRQINDITAFLDCSQIYGSTNEVAESIRVPGSYLLLTKDEKFMPDSNSSNCIKRPGTADYCYLGGDSRANQHTFLSAVHTLWLREHNRIATILRELSSKLANEEIFQITRKIIIAQHQVITYNNYLPTILGDEAKDLTTTDGETKYDHTRDPSINVEFGICFRIGHSTVPSCFPIGNQSVQLIDLYLRPGISHDNFDDIFIGITGVSTASCKHIQAADQYYENAMSRLLFYNSATGRGGDIVSTNIQRGRDHGVQPYVFWRAFCNLTVPTSFNETEILGANGYKLALYYNSVLDLDLYSGMLHEPIDKGLVGPTARCIIRLQFLNTRFGDRFFYDNTGRYRQFTKAQLAALRITTLARVVCFNSGLAFVPMDVFKDASSSNPLVSCDDLRKEDLDFSLFLGESSSIEVADPSAN